jgi:hypothetical protein
MGLGVCLTEDRRTMSKKRILVQLASFACCGNSRISVDQNRIGCEVKVFFLQIVDFVRDFFYRLYVGKAGVR